MDFDTQFQKLYPSLFRYLHRLTGDADVAEDIAQEAFVRLLRQSLPEGEIRPWLFTVAMNLVRDHARKTERRQRLLTSAPTLVTPSALPDENVERTERVARVRRRGVSIAGRGSSAATGSRRFTSVAQRRASREASAIQ